MYQTWRRRGEVEVCWSEARVWVALVCVEGLRRETMWRKAVGFSVDTKGRDSRVGIRQDGLPFISSCLAMPYTMLHGEESHLERVHGLLEELGDSGSLVSCLAYDVRSPGRGD